VRRRTVAVFGMAAQAHAAVTIDTDGYEANVYGFVRAVATYDFDEKNDSLELRHAYGSYNGVLVGRSWSNFNSFVGNPSTLDFDGIPGSAGTQGRTEQIRYTTGALSFSIEQPSSAGVGLDVPAPAFVFDPITGVGIPGTKTSVNTDSIKDSTPAFTVRLEDSQGGLTCSAALMAKQTAYDTATADDNAIGYAAFVAGKFMLTDMLSVNGTFGYADGATGYVYRAGGHCGPGRRSAEHQSGCYHNRHQLHDVH
jgi:hypothetical protein